jgi:uncharacterized membrane protein YphA (DoxX/SURF4 family)
VDLAVIVVSLLLAMALILMGLAKVQTLPASDEIRRRLAIPPPIWRAMGITELLAAAGLVLGAFAIPEVALAAAVLALASLLVLLVAQVRTREPLAFMVPSGALIALAVLDIVLVVTRTT